MNFLNRAPLSARARHIAKSTRSRTAAVLVSLALIGALTVGIAASTVSNAAAATTPVPLGTTQSFAILAGSAITDVPTSVIAGNVGLSPAAGSYYTGLSPAEVAGTIYAVDATGPASSVDNPALLTTAKNDLTTAYNDAASEVSTSTITADLGGQTLTSGVYTSGSSIGLTGTLTLNGGGNPNSVFIFQAPSSTLTTASASQVLLTNGAQACNVFWQVGSSATLGSTSDFAGTILASTSISLDNGVNVNGRLLASTGAVTLIADTVTASTCAAASPTATTTTVTSSVLAAKRAAAAKAKALAAKRAAAAKALAAKKAAAAKANASTTTTTTAKAPPSPLAPAPIPVTG